ncbi:YsnF/AvaK domain-containing protein [Mucilaginibacter lacusdianchii]|uniref:YsnF/AvaK domain-containing protein n=1 Tax=Mucilaginibacter lacusdianchii TaxID=2684211 RepID=UPI00131C37C9|nr:DUF2382 domain-containing protein [Mucilaginibacter sp. JXJ CY 39]
MENWKIFAESKNITREATADKQSVEATTVPVVAEQLQVNKQQVETGKVNISKKVTSEEITVDVPVVREEVVVEKKPINQYIDTVPPAVRQEGDTTIVSVVKEVLVVEKRLMLVEELHITKHRVETTVPTTEILRKEEVEINRVTKL